MADKFVSDPMEIFKVGDQVKVKVTEIDLERKRIALSCKSDAEVVSPTTGKSGSKKARGGKPESGFKNNAFGGLAGLKLK